MNKLEAADWAELRELGKAIGFSEDRLILAEARVNAKRRPFEGPATLLVGRSDGGLDLVIARWLNRDTIELMDREDGEPLVVGAAPSLARPGNVNWPLWASSNTGSGYVYILRSNEIDRQLLLPFGMMSDFDQAIFVTRWIQPLTEPERRLVTDVSKLAQYIHCVVVSLPSEDSNEKEAVEVREYVLQHLKQSGFGNDRVRGIHFWVAEKADDVKNGSYVSKISEMLEMAPKLLAVAQSSQVSRMMQDILTQIMTRAANLPNTTLPGLSEDDVNRQRRDLAQHLAALKAEVIKAEAAFKDSSDLRSFVFNSVLAWRQKNSLSDIWLEYIETIRPGTQSAIFDAVKTKAESLELGAELDKSRVAAIYQRRGKSYQHRLITSLVMALVSGGLAYAGFIALTPALLHSYSLLPNMVMMLSAILGFVLCMQLRAKAGTGGPRTLTAQESPNDAYSRILNWSTFEHELDSWLHKYLLARSATIEERCTMFCRRIDIPLPESLKDNR